jgi:hypothetical protein
MGTIVTFPRERMLGVGRMAGPDAGEVIIFPGVQIERQDFTLADRVEPTRRRRRPTRSVQTAPEDGK